MVELASAEVPPSVETPAAAESPMEEVNQTYATSAEPTPSDEQTFWDGVYEKWRRGTQLWLMTYGGGPSGGYIIDYSSRPRAVLRWSRRFGQDAIITPLPDGIRLIYKDTPGRA